MYDKILILDLDNTIYSWMDAYAPSFIAQIKYLRENTQIAENEIKASFKRVFLKYNSVEVPNAIFELDIWNTYGIDQQKVHKIQLNAQEIFLNEWKRNIKLYPHVKSTIMWAKNNSMLIIGFSDAFSFWIDYRLKSLSLINYFDMVFAMDDNVIMNSDIVRRTKKNKRIISVSPECMKPNTTIIELLISKYNIKRCNIFMVGDSLEKDIVTAKVAGINDIWAKYGTMYKRENGKLLKSITPWDKNKQKKEKETMGVIQPSYIITDFAQLITLVLNKEGGI